MNFFEKFFLLKSKKKEADLSATVALFLNALHNRQYNQATEILNQSENLPKYIQLSNINPFSDLSIDLSDSKEKPKAETLFRTLCEKGCVPHTTDIPLLAQREQNMMLLFELYKKYPTLRVAIEKENPLYKLSAILARPKQDKNATSLFLGMHQAGIKADEASVELLFRQNYNAPLLTYLFLAQPELEPVHLSQKEYAQNCVQSAFQAGNIEGLRVLYSKGADVSNNQLSVLRIKPSEQEVWLRKMALREMNACQKQLF